MKRRDALTAAIAAPALAVPVVADPVEDSPLRASYRQWRAAIAEFNASGFEDESPEDQALFENILVHERKAAAFVPRTIEDYAFKIIFADDRGLIAGDSLCGEAIVRQAYEIVGLTEDFNLFWTVRPGAARDLVGEA